MLLTIATNYLIDFFSIFWQMYVITMSIALILLAGNFIFWLLDKI
ncbi:hypothetical protein SAMN04489866_101222 [Peptococcus niger]|uniref:Uncharacterized protein n=1 Tax=Peptococcus niger TaxID=2741 RepID=A0A1G6S677_PEPNI|nr:hypothetical protein SAMN04489866_101222 [Peptococcus niger]